MSSVPLAWPEPEIVDIPYRENSIPWFMFAYNSIKVAWMLSD